MLVAPLTFLLLGTLPVVLQFGGDGWGVGPLRLSQEGLTTAAGLFVHGIAGTLAIMAGGCLFLHRLFKRSGWL